MNRWIVLAFLLISSSVAVMAHQVGESFIVVQPSHERISGRWEASFHDLDLCLGLDANGDGDVSWDEVQAARRRIEQFFPRAVMLTDGPSRVPMTVEDFRMDHRTLGPYLIMHWSAVPPGVGIISLEYHFMFDFDPYHRGFFKIEENGSEITGILTAYQRSLSLSLPSPASFVSFVKQGVIHIWEGTDHLLFLIALLLPAVLPRNAERVEFRKALIAVAKTVTAFTLAHSITLALAALGFVHAPGAVVETAIALSVALAALNNLKPIWNDRAWVVAFAFGLIHGFGFASVLSELGVSTSTLAQNLFGFNLGVEAGQLAVVLAFFPVAYLLRSTWFYRRLVFMGGSALVFLIAAVWAIERAFSLTIFPALTALLTGAR